MTTRDGVPPGSAPNAHCASPTSDAAATVAFGPFVIDRAALELRRDDRRVPLTPQAVRALILLADRRGKLVTRRELYAALWSADAEVDVDRGLNTVVRQIRRAIGDTVDAPTFLQTYPGRGYRLLPEPPLSAHARRRPWLVWGAGVGLAAAAIAIAVPARKAVPPPSIPVAAREDFLLGRHLLEQPGADQRAKAIDLLTRAVAHAPDYAPAHAYLASALTGAERWDDARRELARAFALDSGVPRAWMVGSFIALVHEWDWERGESLLRRGIALDPGDAAMQASLGFVFATAGRRDSAASALARARALDPVSALVVGDIGRIYRYIGDNEAAAEACEKANALSDDPTFAIECVLDARSALGQFARARAVTARWLSASGLDSLAVLGDARVGDAEAIRRFRTWLAGRIGPRVQAGTYPAFAGALVLSMGNRNQDAVDALARAAAGRGVGFVTTTVEPAFAPLRHNPAFLRIVAPLVRGGAAPPGAGS